MVALKGLLYSLFTLGLTVVVSLLVVGVIKVTYSVIHRGKATKADSK